MLLLQMSKCEIGGRMCGCVCSIVHAFIHLLLQMVCLVFLCEMTSLNHTKWILFVAECVFCRLMIPIYFHFDKSDCERTVGTHTVLRIDAIHAHFIRMCCLSRTSCFISFTILRLTKFGGAFHSNKWETAVYVCSLFYRWNANKFKHSKIVSRRRWRQYQWWWWWHCYFIVPCIIFFFVEHKSSSMSKILHLNECAFVELIPFYHTLNACVC